MIDDYILYKNLPVIDLHGHDRYSAVLKTNEFVEDNYKLGNYLIKIIHGKGEGILKENIHSSLKKNKLVEAYKLDVFNTGTTVIKLKKNNKNE